MSIDGLDIIRNYFQTTHTKAEEALVEVANEVKNISKKTLFRIAVGTTSLILGGFAFKASKKLIQLAADKDLKLLIYHFEIDLRNEVGYIMANGLKAGAGNVSLFSLATIAAIVATVLVVKTVEATVWVWNHLS